MAAYFSPAKLEKATCALPAPGRVLLAAVNCSQPPIFQVNHI
jgi:hypothetical protein